MHLLTYDPNNPVKIFDPNNPVEPYDSSKFNGQYADVVWKEVDKMIKRTNETDANGEKANYWTDNDTGLNCAHISNGMALAYDWCYDYWTKEQKQYI